MVFCSLSSPFHHIIGHIDTVMTIRLLFIVQLNLTYLINKNFSYSYNLFKLGVSQ